MHELLGMIPQQMIQFDKVLQGTTNDIRSDIETSSQSPNQIQALGLWISVSQINYDK